MRSVAARKRVDGVAAGLGAQPDVASVQTFYTTHDPAMVARDRRSTYVVACFKALSNKRLSDDAKLIEGRFASQQDVKLGGSAIADAQVNTQVGTDLAHAELLAFRSSSCSRSCSSGRSSRECCRRCSVDSRSSGRSSC